MRGNKGQSPIQYATIILVIVALVGSWMAYANAGTAKGATKKDVSSLEDRIDTLEKRIKTLKKGQSSIMEKVGAKLPARIYVKSVSAPPAKTGEKATITASVINVGGKSGTKDITLKVAGEPIDTKTVTVPAGKTKTVPFSVKKEKSGDYTVSANGTTTTWSVTGKVRTNVLELYHWWTSGSEKAAINNLIEVYNKKYPDVKIINSPVSGGAGTSMKALMKSLVMGGEAPDAFQIHAGYEMKPYVDGDLLDPITDLWKKNNWPQVYPDVVESMVKFNGEYYAVPVNIHRVNVTFYNKNIFDKYGLSEPTTWQEFWNVCDTLEAKGVTPIALGDTNAWTSAHAFEQILASEGIDFYQKFVNGEVTSADNPKLVDALKKFDKYLDYINEDWAALTWDQATSKVVKGEAAMTIMGDWANGTFKVAEKTYGEDYGSFAVPGTSDMFGICIDSFEHPKGASHPQNSLNWLKVVGSVEGQNAFNPIKGSIPARTDCPKDPYGPYQKNTMDDFSGVSYRYPSIVHGSAAPPAFNSDFTTIMNKFVTSRDISGTAQSIVNSISQNQDKYTKTWSLH